MILQLKIEGLAIIDSLSIDFSPGFNVITGETGAGKSILIRALNLLTGAKASAEAVRTGSAHASVIGQFVVPAGHAALVLLGNLGIPVEDGNLILIRRQITNRGRSQAWINDVLVTSQTLKELGRSLLDVFGQHENQRLMDESQHIHYLDAFLEFPNPKARVARLASECQRLVADLKSTVDSFESRQKSRDYLDFRREELKKFGPELADFMRVSQLCKESDRRLAVHDALARACHCLEGDGESNGISKALREAIRCLGQITSQLPVEGEGAATCVQVNELKDRAGVIATDLEDLSFELGRLASGYDVDERELEEAQERLFGYQDLFRKHNVREIEGLLAEHERLESEIQFLECASLEVGRKLDELAHVAKDLAEGARDLSRSRLKASREIKLSVEKELHELAMPGSVFEVQFSPLRRSFIEPSLSGFGEEAVAAWKSVSETLTTTSENGGEEGRFLLSSNPGEAVLPLTRVASGGELSRIMLALKRALAADAETCVLVFDEIDSGISGRVADVVGKKMRDLSANFQVICISHLPQVAVYADTHLLVKKIGKGDRTESSIIRLSKEESAREIARLLSGSEVSSPSLANARSLIERARGKKPKGNSPARI